MPAIRITFARNELMTDGFLVDEDFTNADHVPRIGEWVVLPPAHCEIIHRNTSPRMAVPAIRYKVVMVEHRWDKLGAPVVFVTIANL